MLNNQQVVYLCKLVALKTIKSDDGTIISVMPSKTDAVVIDTYSNFKLNMGLDDIRFDWLLSPGSCIAGGSVLAWILRENNSTDVDFFFADEEKADNFAQFVGNSFEFVETNKTTYAKTFFHTNGAILQVVGAGRGGISAGIFKSGEALHGTPNTLFGSPIEIINDFDITVCKFAVDKDSVILTKQSVIDLINKRLTFSTINTNRLLKYYRKGFYFKATPKMDLNNNEDNWF